jgi:lipopolysaccharide export system protein LptA
MTSRHARLAVLLLIGAGTAGAQGVEPPSGRCRFIFENTPTTRVNGMKLPSGSYNNFIGGGVVARCPAQRIVLKADSLEHYGDEGRLYFVGHVDYVEPRLNLKSDQLTYFQREERLLATQNVTARLPTGSTLKGPQLEFFRAVPNVRPQQSATATGRPTIALIERDAQGRAQPPVNVTGNTVYLLGDSIVSAQGGVVVVRPSLTATGDSLYVDSGTGLLRIMRTPKIVGTKGRPFTLVGETIDLLSKRRKLDRVLAKNDAEATSEDLNLKSDSIDFRVTDDLLQRAVAWGKGRARATSPTQTIVSDSIDVLMPAQRVREMHAVRAASAEGMPDTTKFRTTEKDRLTGDTIVAWFDTIPARDTASKPRIRELVATGHATSLQHLPPRDTSACVRLPAINYVRGRVITVTFDSAKVQNVVVTDSLAGGVYVEPNADTTCTRLAKQPPAAAAPAIVGAAPAGSRTTPPGQLPPAPPATTPAAPAPVVAPPSKRP